MPRSFSRSSPLLLAAAFALTVPLAPVWAQTAPVGDAAPTEPTAPDAYHPTNAATLGTQSAPGDCLVTGGSSDHTAATADVVADDATAPSNSGSTGWSGGTGGSHIGTNPSDSSTDGRTWQPPTVRGLDLAGRPDPDPVC